MMSSINVLSAADLLLREADELLEKGDIVQASEKYYKAAEEAVKLMVKELNLTEILEKVKEEGYWSLGILHDAVIQLSQRLGNDKIVELWKSAVIILTANLTKEILVIEAEKVRELVELSDKIANLRLD
ncbi:MAG: PaREP1 family protein [Sulfolobaceae archaeon]